MITFNEICNQLPKEPHYLYGRSTIIWAVEDEILCDDKDVAEIVADILEHMGFDEVNTGYYDPEEDAISGEVDNHTGWWYVDI